MSRIDLHMHSQHSADGEYSPQELMTLCAEAGVTVAAVADHNSVRGVAEALEAASLLDITLFPAVELDCTFQGTSLHLLGYWIDPAFPAFDALEKNILAQEQAASKERLRMIHKLGIYASPFQAQRLSHGGVITGEMIAEVALEEPENAENPLLTPYRPGGARSDNPYVNFYWDFCAQGKPGFVPIAYSTLAEAVELVHAAGGIAVLAHPGNNIHENTALLEGIVMQGISGMEVYSSYHSPAQTQFYCEQAKLYGLAASCGSDFHGKIKPKISIGSVNCEEAEAQLLENLKHRWEEKHRCNH